MGRLLTELASNKVLSLATWREGANAPLVLSGIVAQSTPLLGKIAYKFSFLARTYPLREELLSELHRAIGDFNPELGRYRPFILRVLLNKTVSILRKETAQHQYRTPEEAELLRAQDRIFKQTGIAPALESEEVQQQAKLSPKEYRRALRLNRINGRTVSHAEDRASAPREEVSVKAAFNEELEKLHAQLGPRATRYLALRQLGLRYDQIGQIDGCAKSLISTRMSELEAFAQNHFSAEPKRIPVPLWAGKVKPLGFEFLGRELAIAPHASPGWSNLSLYADNLDFFSNIRRSTQKEIAYLRESLGFTQIPFLPQHFPPQGKEIVRALLLKKHPSLDHLSRTPELLRLVDLPRDEVSQATLAKAFIDADLMSPERPAKHPMSGLKYRSLYFNAQAVGPAWAKINARKALYEKFPTLDHVRKDRISAVDCALLGIDPQKGTVEEVRRALLRQRILLPRIPRDHRLPRDTLSAYFDEDLVGPRVKLLNMKRHIGEHYPNLDCLPDRDASLCAMLNCKPNRLSIAARIVELEFPIAKRPANHPYTLRGKKNRSLYFEPTVFKNEERLLENKHSFLREISETLDGFEGRDLRTKQALTLLGLSGVRTLVLYAIKEKVFPAEIPEGHPLSREGGKEMSFYLEEGLIDPTTLASNKEKALRQHCPKASMVKRSKILAQILGCAVSRPAILAALSRYSWFDPNN
jgi:uncharacterized membrane protein